MSEREDFVFSDETWRVTINVHRVVDTPPQWEEWIGKLYVTDLSYNDPPDAQGAQFQEVVAAIKLQLPSDDPNAPGGHYMNGGSRE